MWEIWTNELLPKASKSCIKSNKSPDLVTLLSSSRICKAASARLIRSLLKQEQKNLYAILPTNGIMLHEISVNRCGYIRNFMAIHFHTKVAQIFGNYLGCFGKWQNLSEKAVVTFGELLEQIGLLLIQHLVTLYLME